MKICHNCGESVVSLFEKCPKCGIIPGRSFPPVMVGLLIAAILGVMAVSALIWL